MNSTELQKLVTEIFHSEESKKQFDSNPGAALNRFDLTKEERKAVLDVHSNMGVVTIDSGQMLKGIKAYYNWWSTTGIESYY